MFGGFKAEVLRVSVRALLEVAFCMSWNLSFQYYAVISEGVKLIEFCNMALYLLKVIFPWAARSCGDTRFFWIWGVCTAFIVILLPFFVIVMFPEYIIWARWPVAVMDSVSLLG